MELFTDEQIRDYKSRGFHNVVGVDKESRIYLVRTYDGWIMKSSNELIQNSIFENARSAKFKDEDFENLEEVKEYYNKFMV